MPLIDLARDYAEYTLTRRRVVFIRLPSRRNLADGNARDRLRLARNTFFWDLAPSTPRPDLDQVLRQVELNHQNFHPTRGYRQIVPGRSYQVSRNFLSLSLVTNPVERLAADPAEFLFVRLGEQVYLIATGRENPRGAHLGLDPRYWGFGRRTGVARGMDRVPGDTVGQEGWLPLRALAR